MTLMLSTRTSEGDALTTTLEVSSLTVGYGSQPIVLEATLSVEPREVVVVIGHNGAGKSTLLKGIFGLARLFGGQVSISGQETTGMRPDQVLRSGAAYVAQGQDLFVDMSVEENVWMGGYLLSRRKRDTRTKECMSLFPMLMDKRKAKAGNLSGGQRQQVKLARGLMTDPRLLLLDEPSAGLSPKLVNEAFEELLRLREEAGIAMLIVEQNVKDASAIADRLVVMQAGRVKHIVDTMDLGRSVSLKDLLLTVPGSDGQQNGRETTNQPERQRKEDR